MTCGVCLCLLRQITVPFSKPPGDFPQQIDKIKQSVGYIVDFTTVQVKERVLEFGTYKIYNTTSTARRSTTLRLAKVTFRIFATGNPQLTEWKVARPLGSLSSCNILYAALILRSAPFVGRTRLPLILRSAASNLALCSFCTIHPSRTPGPAVGDCLADKSQIATLVT